MRISDWSSDVCSSDLVGGGGSRARPRVRGDTIMRQILETPQPLGRALMLPIAVLPIAGLLLPIGHPDLLDLAFISAAGPAIFDYLGIFFAIAVADGFTRAGNRAANSGRRAVGQKL